MLLPGGVDPVDRMGSSPPSLWWSEWNELRDSPVGWWWVAGLFSDPLYFGDYNNPIGKSCSNQYNGMIEGFWTLLKWLKMLSDAIRGIPLWCIMVYLLEKSKLTWTFLFENPKVWWFLGFWFGPVSIVWNMLVLYLYIYIYLCIHTSMILEANENHMLLQVAVHDPSRILCQAVLRGTAFLPSCRV